MTVKTYSINKGTAAEIYGLCNVENNIPLYAAPNKWKTEKGAFRWARKHGYEIEGTWGKENPMEEARRKFITVRDALDKSGEQQAFRLCYKKPWRFYKDHTPEEAIEIIKSEASENSNEDHWRKI